MTDDDVVINLSGQRSTHGQGLAEDLAGSIDQDKVEKVLVGSIARSIERARKALEGTDIIMGQEVGTRFLIGLRDGIDGMLADRGAKRVCRAHVTIFEETKCVNCGEEVDDLPWLDGAVTVREDPSARS